MCFVWIFSVKQAKNSTSVHGVATKMAVIFSRLAVISWLGLTTQLILVCHFAVRRLYAAVSCGFVAEDVLFMYSLCFIRDVIKRDPRVLKLYLFFTRIFNKIG
jgi:Tfp pilus assembly PilM family ATPase